MAKTELITLSLLFVITLSFTLVNGYGTVVGGKTKISDVKKNKEVQKLGRFSVEEYNRMQGRLRSNRGTELVFSQVVEAKKQVVSGIKYYLKIEAMQNGLSRTFESVVVVKPWVHSRELLSFSPYSQKG
ncbi:cysteine proteinase inhibitor B-like [Durio zibethinus]|uniref:Cysteine proteinase inhibitor B-like n=1 Tax=Durio zibethinus TaxID=66656 RepID=A0A6P5X2V3_DURZI|nr:cysteine proteinase inhibitor B-like [Durio zibethinus]